MKYNLALEQGGRKLKLIKLSAEHYIETLNQGK
jgi:hypothetical protein